MVAILAHGTRCIGKMDKMLVSTYGQTHVTTKWIVIGFLPVIPSGIIQGIRRDWILLVVYTVMVRAEISYRGTTTTLSEAYIDVVYNRLDACVYIIRNSRYYYARRQVYKAENLDICYVYNQLQSEGVSGGVSQSREARRGGGWNIAERSKRLSKLILDSCLLKRSQHREFRGVQKS